MGLDRSMLAQAVKELGWSPSMLVFERCILGARPRRNMDRYGYRRALCDEE